MIFNLRHQLVTESSIPEHLSTSSNATELIYSSSLASWGQNSTNILYHWILGGKDFDSNTKTPTGRKRTQLEFFLGSNQVVFQISPNFSCPSFSYPGVFNETSILTTFPVVAVGSLSVVAMHSSNWRQLSPIDMFKRLDKWRKTNGSYFTPRTIPAHLRARISGWSRLLSLWFEVSSRCNVTPDALRNTLAFFDRKQPVSRPSANSHVQLNSVFLAFLPGLSSVRVIEGCLSPHSNYISERKIRQLWSVDENQTSRREIPFVERESRLVLSHPYPKQKGQLRESKDEKREVNWIRIFVEKLESPHKPPGALMPYITLEKRKTKQTDRASPPSPQQTLSFLPIFFKSSSFQLCFLFFLKLLLCSLFGCLSLYPCIAASRIVKVPHDSILVTVWLRSSVKHLLLCFVRK